jgi:hypothetical protein
MLVLIDESGCCGFNIARGASPFFTIAMIIFDDKKEAEKISKKITELKNTIKIDTEFKFSGTTPKVKSKFFSTVNGYNFSVRALIIDKVKLHVIYINSMMVFILML